MSRALVEFEQISKRFAAVEVLNEIAFSIPVGSQLALLGPSGCGKSTLLQLLAGLEMPSSGRIRIDGELVSDGVAMLVPPHARSLAMVFQDLALWPNLSALENVVFGLSGRFKLTAAEGRERGQEMLALCGIAALARRKPAELSAGQQQRVAIARALAVRPKLLLLDEPFTGLDLTLKHQLLEEIRSLIARLGVTTILVSHDPWEICNLCSQVIVIEHHEIAEQGSLEELMDAPVSSTMRAITAAMRA